MTALLAPPAARAAGLEASDGTMTDNFGYSLSLSNGLGLIGAHGDYGTGGTTLFAGASYVFRNLDSAAGTVQESLALTSPSETSNGYFGISVSVSGSTGLIGGSGQNANAGAAFVFRALDTASGIPTPAAVLTASDAAPGNSFGNAVSLSGSIGLVGATASASRGSAYVFRNLNTVTGAVTEAAKLTASDAATGDDFGNAVSLSGNTGLIAAYADDDKGFNSGSAYVFRNLDTAPATVSQSAKLVPADGAAGDKFGNAVSLSGSIGLVGAALDDDKGSNSGSAYVFRGLDTATGTVNQSAKLLASDGAATDNFGNAVAVSGSTGLVGSYADDDSGSASGAVYLYHYLSTATGTVTETVKLIASDGADGARFGSAVSLDGDQFLIGAYRADGAAVQSGTAYTGSVSAITTLDEGNASRVIDGLSFTSRTDWIIGQTSDGNQVTLMPGDSGTVTAAGTGVHIGGEAGSDNNGLILQGTLAAGDIFIGSEAGNSGNWLRIDSGAVVAAGTIWLASGNFLSLDGNHTGVDDLPGYLGSTELRVWNGAVWETLDNANQSSLVSQSFNSGFTTFAVVPEPVSAVFLSLGSALFVLQRRRPAV